MTIPNIMINRNNHRISEYAARKFMMNHPDRRRDVELAGIGFAVLVLFVVAINKLSKQCFNTLWLHET